MYTGQSLTVPGKFLAVGDRLSLCTENKAGKLPKYEVFTIAEFWMAADGVEWVNWRLPNRNQINRKRGQETGITGPKQAAALENPALVTDRAGAWWWIGE